MPRYFYTTHTPHQWSGGETIHDRNPDNFSQEITSLEEARKFAQLAQVGSFGQERYVTTTYGVYYNLDEDVDA